MTDMERENWKERKGHDTKIDARKMRLTDHDNDNIYRQDKRNGSN